MYNGYVQIWNSYVKAVESSDRQTDRQTDTTEIIYFAGGPKICGPLKFPELLPPLNKPLGSQAAQSRCTVVRPMQKSIGKWEIRPPVKSWPVKISTWNFAYVITSARWPKMQNLVSIGEVGASPQIGEILHFVTFLFDCPVLSFFFSGTRPGRTAEPIFTLYGSNDVFPRKEVPFGG